MKELRLRAVDKIVKKNGLFVTPLKLSENNYNTGQTVVIGDPTTVDYLTFDEISGKKMLSEKKMKQFPFVIKPNARYHFNDGHKFDLDNPESKALYELILVSHPHVAKTKDSFDRMYHTCYIENKVMESEIKTKNFKKNVQAGIAISELNKDGLNDLAAYLFVNHNEQRCSSSQHPSVIEAALYDYANTKPEIITDALKEENKKAMYISNLVISGILTKRGSGEFYEGNTFVANDFVKLVALYSVDLQKASRWDKKYRELNLNRHIVFKEAPVDVVSISNNFLKAIISEDVDTLKLIVAEIKTSNNNELMELLVKYNDKINSIINTSKTTSNGNNEFTPLSKSELLVSLEEENFLTFKSKFVKSLPEYGGEFKKESMKLYLESK